MGILLMCLSPALYCNVTDAWTIADKWKRIIISFAGIYVELIIAAISTFVWWYTPDMPVVNNIALCLMTLCSVSTFLFNANPLMRFDGYYIMADWLEIPNLRDRSNRYITNLFLEKALGVEVPPEQYMATGRKVLFVTYAVTSWVYRWVITFSIIWMLSDFLGPRLRVISHMIAILSLVSMFIWPIYRMIKNIHQRGRLPDMKAARVWVTLMIFSGILATFFLLPLPISRVRETALVTLHPDHAMGVGLAEPAHLTSLQVEEGQSVRRDQVLARFMSPLLKEEIERTEAQRIQSLALANDYDRMIAEQKTNRNQPESSVDDLRTEQAVQLARSRAFSDLAEDLKRRDANLFEMKSPRDGVVMGVPKQTDLGKLFDRNFQDQRPICTVGDPTKLIVKVPVSPNDYKLLKDDLFSNGSLDVSIFVKGRTDRIFKGKLTRLPESDAKQVPFALTQRGGGPLAVKPAGDGGQETLPVAQTYLVEVEFSDPDATIRPGALVNAKIHCQWRTGAWWVYRAIATALDVGLY